MRQRTKFYAVTCGFVVSFILFHIGLRNSKHGFRFFKTTNFTDLPNVNKILQETRSRIKEELWNYNFTDGGFDKLQDLVMETGGSPLRSIIMTSWRSGSSFLGDLLNMNPGSFYNYEPFGYIKAKQLRGRREESNAVTVLINLLKCNFSKHYFKFIQIHNSFYTRNKRLAQACTVNNDNRLCFDANITAQICKLFPFQITKVVRVRLHVARKILDDAELGVKVVFLIRDPRAVITSRLHKNFCSNADCIDPNVVCADMVDDYDAARQLLQKHPDRFRILRFEDFALNLTATTLELTKFLRFDYSQSIKDFIASHSNITLGGQFSTFRVTRNVPFEWKKIMEFDKVLKIQEACKRAMNIWGYHLAHNASHMSSEDFYPLGPFLVA